MISAEYRLIRQTAEELDDISTHLLRGVDPESFKPDGTFGSDNIILWSPRLLGISSNRDLRFSVGGSGVARHLSVFIEDSPYRLLPRPIIAVYPEHIRVVQTREENLRVGVLGYIIGDDKEIADELMAEINSENEDFFVEGRHDIWHKLDLEYHPQRVSRLVLQPSATQIVLPDPRNFVIIGERNQILPVSLKFVRKEMVENNLVNSHTV